MFENDLGATDPRNVTIRRTPGGAANTVDELLDQGFSLAEINFYLSNPAFGPWVATAGEFPDVASLLNPAGYALLELTNAWRSPYFGGTSVWTPQYGRGVAGDYSETETTVSTQPLYYIT
jgi:hypothetical protein